MTLSELIQATIDDTATEKILFRTPRRELKKTPMRILKNAHAGFFLEGAKVENVYFTDKYLGLILSKENHVYQLDWCDGYGITLAEMTPPDGGKVK